MVAGDDDGLRNIAAAFRSSGVPVQAIYLIKRLSFDFDEPIWTVVAVVEPFARETHGRFTAAQVRLRRAGKFPAVDPAVRMSAVPADDPEAATLLAYARRFGPPPLTLRDIHIDGRHVEFALIAEDLTAQSVAA